jgi:glycosyltransferase involved in cell wall biosynthesis
MTPASKARRSLVIGVPELFLELHIDFWRFHQKSEICDKNLYLMSRLNYSVEWRNRIVYIDGRYLLKMRIAIGHYSIGASDGVNTVIWRTVHELHQIDPTLQICLFGKTTAKIDHFLPWHKEKLSYRDIKEMSPDYRIPGLEGKNVQIQRVHDYIWHGTNVAEHLQAQFADYDIVLMENLSIGINPAITYAFYLWTLREYQAGSNKRFFVRVHDFAQQRPANFSNIKKFQAFLPTEMPDWHQILYPSTPNIEYITINTIDYYRILDHGIEPLKVWYVPNGIDNSLSRPFGKCDELRQLLNTRKGVDPDASILFYPVRAIPRKNVEEAIFLLHLLNNLAKDEEYRSKYCLDTKFHLVVSLSGQSESEKQYIEILRDFARKNNLPVTIDISDLVGLHREYDPEDPTKIIKYGVVDMYSISRMTVTTSIMEGFGFVFIEPWAVQNCVIGRNISSVTVDFKKAGIALDHLYTVLLVNGVDYADLGIQDSDKGLSRRLQEIAKLEDPIYLRMILNKNSAPLKATLKLFRPERRQSLRRNLIRANQKKVLQNYSSKEVVGILYRIMQQTEPPYHELRFARPKTVNSALT